MVCPLFFSFFFWGVDVLRLFVLVFLSLLHLFLGDNASPNDIKSFHCFDVSGYHGLFWCFILDSQPRFCFYPKKVTTCF